MRTVSLAALLVVLCCAPPARADGDGELRQFVTQAAQSWSTMDFSKIERYYATDADSVWFDVLPMKFAGWAEYKAGAQQLLFEPNQALKLTLNDDPQGQVRR